MGVWSEHLDLALGVVACFFFLERYFITLETARFFHTSVIDQVLCLFTIYFDLMNVNSEASVLHLTHKSVGQMNFN